MNPAEFKSYWDLLIPKWKGKMASLDPTSFGMGATLQFFYFNPELGPLFLRKLYGEMQVTISRDARQMTDWLAAGKYFLCIRCNAGSEVGKAVQQKLPIGYLDTEDWKEGGSSSAAGGTLGIPTRVPHPNAAKVFLNWFLSREGQTALQKLGRPDAHNSRRIDIPKDDVDAFNRLEEGKKYFDLAKPEFQDLSPIFKLVKEVLPQNSRWGSRGYCICAPVCANQKIRNGVIAMKQTCFVCQNVDCQSRGSEQLMDDLTKQVAARSIDAEVKPYICFGGCEYGPNIVVHPQKFWYAGVKSQDLPEIVDSLAGGPPVSRLDTIDPSLKEIVYSLLDTGVF